MKTSANPIFIVAILGLLQEASLAFLVGRASVKHNHQQVGRQLVTDPSNAISQRRTRSIPRRKFVPTRSTQRRTKSSQRHQDETSWKEKWAKAETVERRVLAALEYMKEPNNNPHQYLFPNVRDCNSALATFGDGGEYLRALGLFLKMRKATTMFKKQQQSAKTNQLLLVVPAPTLVTYSTLMSRAVRFGKERLALRLWNLMKTQAEFFSSPSKTHSVIVPDVKAANILMNVYSKLADMESAQNLMSQMMHGNGTDVPKLHPNLVTYNTLLDACHRAGDLDAALQAKKQMQASGIRPDARTYTSLIASVGRKQSIVSGANDPTIAFSFLDEMNSQGIRPNGMTYSALIDACARCGRTDMALQGLRTMLRHKARERRRGSRNQKSTFSLHNEVGAWTAAINALGKEGRIETALRLFFYVMPKIGVQPNTITCGCLTDSLLKNGRTSDALDVLQYMKQENISPSEVMYTSLMTSAGRMVERENKRKWNGPIFSQNETASEDGEDAKAIDVYTALIKALSEVEGPDKKSGLANTQLMKVFLIFQEMKATGAEPDLACYNALLHACAREGDMPRALDVIRQIQNDGLFATDTTWRIALKCASTARNSRAASEVWQKAAAARDSRTSNSGGGSSSWQPSSESFSVYLSSFLREATVTRDETIRIGLYKQVISIYRNVMTGSEKRLFDKSAMLRNTRALGSILRAIALLDSTVEVGADSKVLRRVGASIAGFDVWKSKSLKLDGQTSRHLQTAKNWARELALSP